MSGQRSRTSRLAHAPQRLIALIGVLIVAMAGGSAVALASNGSGVSLPPSLGTPLSDAEQLVNGTAGNLFSTVTGKVCSAAQSSPLSSILGEGSTLACELQFLQFDFHTVYQAPGGKQIVRDTFALPEVPTLIDLTGDGIPDALAWVTVSSTDSFSLEISKLPTAAGTLPASVELVVRDPTNPGSESRIAAGYDALSSTIPTNFDATLTLDSLSPLQLGLAVTDKKPGSDLALIGSLYDQPPSGTPQVQTAVRLDYSPVPASLGYNVLLASQHEHLTATASSPSTVTASVQLNDGNDHKTINGTINQIPSRVDVDVINGGPNDRQITYTGSSAIGQLDASYQDQTVFAGGGTQLNTQMVGKVNSLPTGVTFQQTSATQFSVVTSGGPIGYADGGFATGEPVTDVPGTEAGVYLKTGGGLQTAAARISGLSSLIADYSKPYRIDVVSTSQPMQVLDDDDDDGVTVTSSIENLPAHLTLTVDPVNGQIDEDGYGQAINQITATAQQTTPFFGQISRIGATLTGIPASFKLNYNFNQDAGGQDTFSAGIDNPISEIQLTADDGNHSVTVPGTDSGVNVVDTPSEFASAVTVYGLQSLSFVANPTTFAQNPALDLAVQSAAGHVWNYAAKMQPHGAILPLTASGVIDQLPAQLTLAVKSDASANSTDVVYTGSSAIDHIGLDLTAPGNPFIGDADHVHLDAYTIPESFDATMVQNPDGSFVASVDHPVREIDFGLDNGSDAQTVPGADSGLAVLLKAATVPATSSTPKSLKINTLAAAGRIFGLSKVSYDPNPETIEVDSAGGHTFNYDADVTLDGNEITANGEVDQLPSSLEAEIEPGSDGLSDIVYNASDPIDHVSVDTTDSQPFFGTVTHIKADVYKVPADFVANIDNESDGGIAVNMNNPAGEVDLQMDDGNTSLPAAGTDSWVDFVDAGGHFGVAARVFGVTKFSFDPSPMTVAVDSAGGHHFDYAGSMDAGTEASPNPVTFTGSISTLPSSVSAEVAPLPDGNSAIIYKASSPIDEATVDANSSAPLFDEVTHINADITKIPAAFTMEVGYQNGQFTAETDHSPGEVKLRADSGSGLFTPQPYVYGEDGQQIQPAADGSVIPDGADGVAANITNDGEAFAAQIYGLNTLTLDMTPPPGQKPDQNSDSNLAVHVNAEGGHELYATVHQATDNGQGLVPQLEVGAFVRDMPSDFGFSQTSSNTSGTDMKYYASDPITDMKVHVEDSAGPLMATSDDLYSEIQGLPATEPDAPIEISVPATGEPQVKFTNQGASGPRTIKRLVFELLPSSEAKNTDNFFSQPLDLPTSNQSLPYPNLAGPNWTGNETQDPSDPEVQDVSSTVTAPPDYDSGAQTDPNADGLYLRVNTSDKLDGQGNPIPNPPPATGDETQLDKFVIAAAISGLRQGSFDAGPPVSANLDVDPAYAQPFGFDVEVEGPTPGPTVEGFIDKLPPNMQLNFNSNPEVQLNYSADSPDGSTVSIAEMHLFAQNVGVPQMDLDIKNIPTKLNVCLAPGAPQGGTECLPPTPAGYPNEQTGIDAGGNSYTEFEQHSVTADFDDDGTSDNGPPMSVNGYICVTGVPQTFGDPMGNGREPGNCAPPLTVPWGVPGQTPVTDPQDDPYGNSNFFNDIPTVVKIDNLTFHKFFADAFGTVCDGAYVCAKTWIDTGGLPASGDVYYVSSSFTNGGGWAGLLMPPGFSANNAYLMYHNGGADLPKGTVFDAGVTDIFHTPGTVNCPANAYGFLGIHAHVNTAGISVANANLYNNVCSEDG